MAAQIPSASGATNVRWLMEEVGILRRRFESIPLNSVELILARCGPRLLPKDVAAEFGAEYSLKSVTRKWLVADTCFIEQRGGLGGFYQVMVKAKSTEDFSLFIQAANRSAKLAGDAGDTLNLSEATCDVRGLCLWAGAIRDLRYQHRQFFPGQFGWMPLYSVAWVRAEKKSKLTKRQPDEAAKQFQMAGDYVSIYDAVECSSDALRVIERIVSGDQIPEELPVAAGAAEESAETSDGAESLDAEGYPPRPVLYWHSSDFDKVIWDGKRLKFPTKSAAAIKIIQHQGEIDRPELAKRLYQMGLASKNATRTDIFKAKTKDWKLLVEVRNTQNSCTLLARRPSGGWAVIQ